MNKKTIGFSYGMCSDTLKEQAKKQGFDLNDSEKYEKLKNSLNWLMIHNISNDSQHNIMTNKLHKMVVKDLKTSSNTDYKNN